MVGTKRLAYTYTPMHGMSKRAMGLLKLILGLAGLVLTVGLGILLILTPAQASLVPLLPDASRNTTPDLVSQQLIVS